jgi:hypothetical protein
MQPGVIETTREKRAATLSDDGPSSSIDAILAVPCAVKQN